MTVSLYGEPFNPGEDKDLYVENEELKEEIQKLASQIQYVKIVGMMMENHHLKSKKEGYFSKENFTKNFLQVKDNQGSRKCERIPTLHLTVGIFT